MSAARARIRAKSIVGLYGDAAIERLPIEEVTADLERLGVDPAPSIDLARRLAAGATADPATALLRKLEMAEDVEAEIAALERAPIEEIRSKLPEGAAEAKDRAMDDGRADAHDQSAEQASAPPIKRGRRRAVLGWGGSLVGIAASVVVLLAVRSEFLEPTGWSDAPRSAIDGASSVEKADPAAVSDAAGETTPEEEALHDQTAEREASPVMRARGLPSQALEAAPAAVRRPADQEERAGLAMTTVEADQQAAEASPAADIPGLASLPGDLTGVFVVDADGVPPALQALASAKSDDRLAAKLGEARRRAPGRKVVALLAFERDGRRVDAALVENVPASSLDTVPTTAAEVTARGESEPRAFAAFERSYQLIELPSER